MSTASSKSVEKLKNAEVSDEEGTSSASPSTPIGQQQTAGDSSVTEEAFFSPTAALIDHQNAGSSTEDQLRKKMGRLEDEIHKLKLDQDPKREAVKHTLLRDELAQLREENLNLRVELQVAQESVRLLEKKLEKHQVLGSELEGCKQLMQKAIDGLSTGFELSNEKSPNLGLATTAAPFGASLLPQQSVSSGPVETAARVSNPFDSKKDKSSSTFPTSTTNTNTSIKLDTFGLPPSHTAAGFDDSPQRYKPALRYGDTGKSVQQEDDKNTPHWQNQSVEEARLRHYEHYNGIPETELGATPKLQGTLGKSTLGSTRASDYSTLFGGSSMSRGNTIFRTNKDPKVGKHSGGRNA